MSAPRGYPRYQERKREASSRLTGGTGGVRSASPASRPCADLRACDRNLPAASTARARGHTCRTRPARPLPHSPALLSLLRSDLAGRERQRANGTAAENPGMTGLRGSPPRWPPRILARNKNAKAIWFMRAADRGSCGSSLMLLSRAASPSLGCPEKIRVSASSWCAEARFGVVANARSASARPPS